MDYDNDSPKKVVLNQIFSLIFFFIFELWLPTSNAIFSVISCLCSLESPFQVVLKNDLSFYDRTHMTKVMADESLSTIFLDTL